MTEELTLVSAFLVGFLGSVHCIGMCGGIVGALTVGSSSIENKGLSQKPNATALYLIYYNLGRILSYSIAGGIAGFIGSQVIHTSLLPNGQWIGMVISSVFMIALGLYISGWWQGLIALEKLGSKIWQFIQPASKYFLPIKSSWHAIILGLIWGWLPCGLVYTALVWSLSAGSAIKGASLMMAFGLGTLPTLLALGVFAKWLENVRNKPIVRKTAGLIIIGFGLYLLFSSNQHYHHVVSMG